MRRLLCIALVIGGLACSRESHSPAPGHGRSGPAGAKVPTPTEKSRATEVGDAMPAYRGRLLNGSDFQLDSLRGSVVLLNVWATWCGPCRFEIPELEALQKRSGSGLKVVGVSVDEGSEDSVKQFVAAQKMTYTVAIDPEGRIANLLQTTVLPTSVLIDKRGKIVWRQVGAVAPGDAKLQAALTAALGTSKKS